MAKENHRWTIAYQSLFLTLLSTHTNNISSWMDDIFSYTNTHDLQVGQDDAQILDYDILPFIWKDNLQKNHIYYI